MMFGSILYNLWGALIAFSIYFFLNFTAPAAPWVIISKSFVAAVIGFLVTYIIRFLISYVLYTPETDEIVEEEKEEATMPSSATADEFEEENPEEVAKAVRTMMEEENQAAS